VAAHGAGAIECELGVSANFLAKILHSGLSALDGLRQQPLERPDLNARHCSAGAIDSLTAPFEGARAGPERVPE
jgi:hypothetical protein